jgi:sugar lactone lactonase YvrE
LNGLAAGPENSIYYSEHAAVRKLDARGAITTIAEGIKVPGCSIIPFDEPPPRPYLRGLAVAADGTVYVAAEGCGALMRLQKGVVTVILRTRSPWSPTAVAVVGSDIFVLEYSHTSVDDRRQWLPRVRKIARDGKLSTLALVSRR